MVFLRTITNRFSKMNLRYKVLAVTLLLSFFQVLFIGTVIYVSNSKIILNSEREKLNQLIAVINEDLESRIDTFNSVTLDILINENIKKNLNLSDPLYHGQARRSIVSFLTNKSTSTKGIIDISIIDLAIHHYSVRATYYLPPLFELMETDVYDKASKLNGGLLWLTQNDINEKYAKDHISLSPLKGLTGAAVIKDYSANKTLGILIIVIEDCYFENIDYSGYKLKDVTISLVSPDKTKIIPVNSNNRTRDMSFIKSLDFKQSDGDEVVSTINEQTQENISYIKNNSMGWYLVCVNNSGYLMRTFYQTVSILIFTLLISLFACMIFAGTFSDSITRGLHELVVKMKLVEKGNFDIRINSQRKDEIGQVSNGFDNMVKKTKLLIQQKYEQELLTKETRFRALQAQINPHFLYNTLDMINWRLLENGQDEISETIVSLGSLLRYSIEGGNTTVTLADEIRNVEDYLLLRKASSQNLFDYTVKLEISTGVILPRLTIQPLVENAIVHGFGRRRHNNLLTIKGYMKNGQCIIDIIDNGIGISPEKLQEIKNAMEMDNSESSHIGIYNVNQRIRHMHGKNSGISITSQEGYGTLVSIFVPLKGDEHSEHCDC